MVWTDHNWDYQGKENQKELGLDWHDFGARQYDAALGRWMSSDPLSEEFYGYSPYNAMMNDPINFVDPTGMAAEWIPKVNEDGSTLYIAEEGDSAETLSSQYGISQSDAEGITGTTGDAEIAEGTEISGETVNNVTGSEVLSLDLNSDLATDQRVFDQFVFARDHSASKGEYSFLSTDYYGNTEYKNVLSGNANLTIDGTSTSVHYEIPVYRPGTFSGSNAVALSNESFTIRQKGATHLGSNQDNVRAELYHPTTGNRLGNYDISVHRSNSNKFYKRMQKEFPRYNYIRVPQKTKN